MSSAAPVNSPEHTMRLREAALDFACQWGLTSLTARRFAKATGARVAAINYYFGNREVLVSELSEMTASSLEAVRSTVRDELPTWVPAWARWDTMFSALLCETIERNRMMVALHLELEREAFGGRCDAAKPIIARSLEIEASFWRELAMERGETEGGAECWVDLAMGMMQHLSSEPSASRRIALAAKPAERLFERLHDEHVSMIDTQNWVAAQFAQAAPRSGTAEKIIAAAISLIGEKGAGSLSQREVAALAGLSLASVTYFFPSKAELIRAALDEILRSYCAAMLGDNKAEIFGDVEEALASFNETNLKARAALDALLHAATHDDSLQGTATLIRQLRGSSTVIQLQQRGVDADLLDGCVWTLMRGGAVRHARTGDPIDMRAQLVSSARTSFEAIFGNGLLHG